MAAEREALGDIIAKCAGLPLALGIVAAWGIVNTHLPLTALARELQAESTRLDTLQSEDRTGLREVIGASYHVLAPREADAFAHLGLMPGPHFNLLNTAPLIGHSIPHTRMLLHRLEASHLVDQYVPGRYRLHDLVRLYAAERAALDLSEDDRVAAMRRLVRFYLNCVRSQSPALASMSRCHRPDCPGSL
ncbi:hypothetical protein [Spongiactinospora gelatinilytica]|uniref:hypothetical protein n=1 Tax=Spongiactinospora gelatinilytica TaxID=2666298 RepID=UPI0011B93877|nr:hypothetical protein [Spongiactinospora gelatinilytica]